MKESAPWILQHIQIKNTGSRINPNLTGCKGGAADPISSGIFEHRKRGLGNKYMVLEAKYKKSREMRFVQGEKFLDLLEDAEKLWNGQREGIFVCEEDEWAWRCMLDKSADTQSY